MLKPNWRPGFITFANADILTGFTGPFWQALLQTQEYAGVEFPVRNFVQPTLLTGIRKDTTNNIAQPALVQLVDTGNNRNAVLTATDKIASASYSAPAQTSVGVASAEAVAAKTGRLYLCLVNTSANWIYLAFGQAAEVGKGIALGPNGGSYEMTAAAGNLTDAQIRAIASAAASNLAIQEA